MASILQFALPSQLNNYTSAAILTAVGYDYALTFSKEIEYIWKSPWKRVSTLFVLTRYFGLCYVVIFSLLGTTFFTFSEKTCEYTCPVSTVVNDAIQGNTLALFGQWAGFIFIGTANLVLALRVWALYRRSKFILCALLTLYAIGVVVGLVSCIVLSTRKNTIVVMYQIFDVSVCLPQFDPPSRFWAEIMDPVQLVLGATMCLLVATRFTMQALQMYKVTKRFHISRYMALLVREGLFYFVIILIFAVINVSYYAASVPLTGWSVTVLATMQYVPFTLAPRFILGLRELHTRELIRGHGGDIDTPFGLASGFCYGTSGAAATAIMFTQNEFGVQEEDFCGDDTTSTEPPSPSSRNNEATLFEVL